MTMFLLTFLIVSLLFAGMAIGVIVSNKPVKGSCGGLAALGMDTECEICGGDKEICETEQQKNSEVDKVGSKSAVKTTDAMKPYK